MSSNSDAAPEAPAEIVTRTETVTQNRLRDIANKPNHTVYEYTYDTPETTLEPQQQIALFRGIVSAFDGLCQRHKDLCDEALRERLLASSDGARLFQRLYPYLFAACTVRALDDDMLLRLDKTRKANMASLLERWKGDGDEDMKAARAMSTAMRLSMRPTRAEDLENSVRLDQQLEEARAPAAALTPLDPAELGPSTVRQK